MINYSYSLLCTNKRSCMQNISSLEEVLLAAFAYPVFVFYYFIWESEKEIAYFCG